MQVFQRSLQQFTNNLEYYIKTRAIQSICIDLDKKLKDIEEEYIQQITTSFDENEMGGVMTDMDELIIIHNDFLSNILKSCILEQKNRQYHDLLMNLLQVCLDFRILCKHYLLTGSNDNEDDDGEDDLGLNLSSDDDRENYSSTQNRELGKYGKGQLRCDSHNF